MAQMTLRFEPGLAQRYGSLRECIATGIYQRGLGRVAARIDQAPSNLSVQLSEDSARKFSVDSFEEYIEKFSDLTPIYYLLEKFVRDPDATANNALAQVPELVENLQAMLRKAGMA